MTEEYLKEITDRMRRLETRLTKFLEMQGFDTKVRRPVFEDGVVNIPSRACSITDIVNAVPASWDKEQEVEVWHKDEFIAYLYVGAPE